VFQGWSDDAVRGYIVMLEGTFLTGSLKPTYERRVVEAKQELLVRDHRARLVREAKVSGSK
jgi:hypothetical protein